MWWRSVLFLVHDDVAVHLLNTPNTTHHYHESHHLLYTPQSRLVTHHHTTHHISLHLILNIAHHTTPLHLHYHTTTMQSTPRTTTPHYHTETVPNTTTWRRRLHLLLC